jgi:uncharacterized protein DUF3631
VRETFATKKVDRLSTEEIVNHLISLEERNWSELRHGRAITKAWVSRHLSALGVQSETIWLTAERSLKGYHLKSFADAFERYLDTPSAPSHDVSRRDPSSQSVKASEQANDGHISHFQNVRNEGDLTFSKSQKPLSHGHSDGLTFYGGEEVWEIEL